MVHAHCEGSDPLVVSLMRFPRRKRTPPTPEMAEFLKPQDGVESDEESQEECDADAGADDGDSDSEYEP